MSHSALSLARPWRMFFYTDETISTNSDYYRQIREAYLAKDHCLLPEEAFDDWNACQGDGIIEFEGENKTLRAKFQFIGTFNYDDNSFLWADENSSLKEELLQDAIAFRQQDGAGPYASMRKFSCWPRDSIALLVQAVNGLACDTGYAASSNNNLILLTLRKLEEKKPFTFWKSKKKADNPFENPFTLVQRLIDQGVRDVQPEDPLLAETEQDCQKAFELYQAGDFEAVMRVIAQIKSKLGEPFGDKEPSGWVYLCEGCTHLALGNHNEARNAFSEAGRAVLSIDYPTQLLGLSRASVTPEDKASYLSAAYIRNPEKFLRIASQDEQAHISQLLSELFGETREEHMDPQRVWAESMSSYFEIEGQAYARSRDESRVRREQGDEVAYKLYQESQSLSNEAYQKFCLTWMTPGRYPNLSSYSSDPDFGPNKEHITDVTFQSENVCAISTIQKDNTHNLGKRHRYELVKIAPPLASEPRWLIDKIWSVWDDEEIELFE